jgi:2,3-bisphosphoglycerate-independent phosphoglycerate mutase
MVSSSVKKLFIVIDGMSEHPLKSLNNRTPLEVAKTPNMDFLAKHGRCGNMDVIDKNIAPESDEAMLALLGYDPYRYHRGRGPLEAHGAGVEFKNEIVLRANFATADKNGYILDIRAKDLTRKEVMSMANSLNMIIDNVKIRVVPTVGYRAVVMLSGKDLSPDITNTHPGYRRMKGYVVDSRPTNKRLKVRKCRAFKKTANAKRTARIVNEFTMRARKILENHKVNEKRKRKGLKPKNILLLRGAGNSLPRLRRMKDRWALFADMPVEKSIGKLTGMEVLKKPKTAKESAKAILKTWKKYDAFFIQIKGPDAFGHRGEVKKKIESIEEIDEDFFGTLMNKINEAVLCVTGDHSTSCETKSHTAYPVPFLIFGSDVTEPDGVERFNEKACKNGALGRIKGLDIRKNLKIYYQ